MVRLSKIYTKTGDAGATALGDGATVPKHDPRVDAYGDVDEANAALGLAVATIPVDSADPTSADIRAVLLRAQNDMFDVGADLCVPCEPAEKPGSRLRIIQAQIDHLERTIDRFNERLAPLNSFVLPGGSTLAAHLHLARTVVRRAERRVSALLASAPAATNPLTLVYLNRLSDLLFVLARIANNDGAADVTWTPGAGRSPGAGQ